jgi:transcriptional regulator with XRE-family HTH domain
MIERGYNKAELSRQSGVSYPFICDLVNGTGNPSIKILEQLARALRIDLPRLLEQHEQDTWIGDPIKIPEGYERVSGIVPRFDAYVFKKKADKTQKMLNAKQKRGR